MHEQHKVLKQLQALLALPETAEEIAAWLGLGASLDFLEENARSDSVVLFISAGHMYVHSVLAPTTAVSPPDFEDLSHWHADPSGSWSMSYSANKTWISTPLESEASKSLRKGEQIVFLRGFEGVPSRASYVEILQPLTHVFGLHYMPERDAWCRLDRLGDIEDVFRVVTLQEPGAKARQGRVVLGSRQVLDEYAALTNATLVRLFDFTCILSQRFSMWGSEDSDRRNHGENIAYRYGSLDGTASYGRGAQIIPTITTRDEVGRAFWDGDEDKKYATFIAYDRKHDQVRELSCAPNALANYFTKSDKPWEITPAFFKPEVLLKYKSDREKYKLDHRSIGCRGAWYLKTYDTNEEGQVHTYLGYLNKLPFEEQLHWKQYNEAPKGGISKRALKTDLYGTWDESYDPLLSLKAKLRRLEEANVAWWTLRGRDLPDRVHYPATASPDEWAEELLNLDQLLVEGFEEKVLRAKCIELGQQPDDQMRSLGLLQLCLVGAGFEEEHAQRILAPLKSLHHLRSKAKGHAGGESAKLMRQSILQEHGTLRDHYRALAQACDESLDVITNALKGA